jgi:hypothetical protein
MTRRWPAERASAALRYLRDTLGHETKSTVIMLQEVRNESLQAILNDRWIQGNFLLSDADPRPSRYADVLDRKLFAEAYFTMMLVSKDLGTSN